MIYRGMKPTVLPFCIMMLLGCQARNSEDSQVVHNYKLESFVQSFLDSNKNWNQNDIVQEKVNEKFKDDVAIEIANGVLDDYPLELGEINQYEKGKYAAVFKGHYIKETIPYKSLLYHTYFDVIGIVSPNAVDTLKESQAYVVKGKFRGFLKNEFMHYIKGAVYTPRVGIESGMSGMEINLGIILMDVQSIDRADKL